MNYQVTSFLSVLAVSGECVWDGGVASAPHLCDTKAVSKERRVVEHALTRVIEDIQNFYHHNPGSRGELDGTVQVAQRALDMLRERTEQNKEHERQENDQ
jgi:hypothetical protein